MLLKVACAGSEAVFGGRAAPQGSSRVDVSPWISKCHCFVSTTACRLGPRISYLRSLFNTAETLRLSQPSALGDLFASRALERRSGGAPASHANLCQLAAKVEASQDILPPLADNSFWTQLAAEIQQHCRSLGSVEHIMSKLSPALIGTPAHANPVSDGSERCLRTPSLEREIYRATRSELSVCQIP